MRVTSIAELGFIDRNAGPISKVDLSRRSLDRGASVWRSGHLILKYSASGLHALGSDWALC